MKKNLLLLLFSSIISLILLYLILYGYTYSNINKENTYKFSSLEILNFHKKYSNKIHHIRLDETNIKKEFKPNEYLYSVISSFKTDQKNILFQGDSWSEQLTLLEDADTGYLKARNFVKNFTKKNKLGFINAGITSYSPTLMKLQLELLEKDFDIRPNIVIAYIDQTDIGDENCRYKNNRILKNNKIIAVKVESHSGRPFDYSKIYGESEIFLRKESKIKKTFDLVNFGIKYKYTKYKKKNIEKFRRIIKYGFKSRKVKKCYWSDIQRHLINSTDEEIRYFEETVENYINYIEKNNNIEKLFIITFPHKNHLPELLNETDKQYKHNVSDIIEKLVINRRKISHLNFTKLINEKNIYISKENYKKDDPASHLKPDYYNNLFIKKIIDYVFNDLNT